MLGFKVNGEDIGGDITSPVDNTIAENEAELNSQKQQFAAGLLSGRYTLFELAAAIAPGPGNQSLQLQISELWQFDPEVLQAKNDLIAQFGHDYFLPTREEALQDLYSLSKTAFDPEVKRKSLVDYLKFKGNAQAGGGTTINNTSVTQNNVNQTFNDNSKVLKYQDFGTDDQHARGLEAQQKRLRAGSL